MEIPHAYIIPYKYYLALSDLTENLYLASRHISLSYTQMVLTSIK